MYQDMYAHKVGELAFLEIKLSLTASQEPLFARWKQTSLESSMPARAPPANAASPVTPRYDGPVEHRRNHA